ncbi:hypothetical protein LEMLEM_LOCUS27681 [Lemmus lemmus]
MSTCVFFPPHSVSSVPHCGSSCFFEDAEVKLRGSLGIWRNGSEVKRICCLAQDPGSRLSAHSCL